MAYINLVRLKNKVQFFFIIALSIVLCSCNITKEQDEQSVVLPEFKIINNHLDSITTDFVKRISSIKRHDKILVLSFENTNDTLNFVYSTCISMQSLRKNYIYRQNYRLIGYLEQDNFDMILITNINSFYQMIVDLKKFIKPIDNNKQFAGLYYQPVEIKDWNDEWIYDGDTRWHFKYVNNKFQGPYRSID